MTRQEHYAGLDLLRIAAAYFVFFNHIGQYNSHYDALNHGANESWPLAFPFMEWFSGIGSVGVEIFFVISGFVIAASVQNATPLQFVQRRVIRVAPALWICSSIALMARYTTGEPIGYLLGCWFRSVTLLPVGPTIDGVVWTLVVEAIFYLTVFISILISARALPTLAKTIGFASVIYMVGLAAARLGHAAHIEGIFGQVSFKLFLSRHGVFFGLSTFLLLRHGVFFAAGMLAWQWILEGRPRERLPLIALFGVFGALEILLSSEKPLWGAVLALAIWLTGMVWMICSVCFNHKVNAWFAPARTFVANLGRLSYTLYLTHYAFGMVLVSALFSFGLGKIPAFLVTVTIVSAVAWLVMIWPERYFQKIMKSGFGAFGALYDRRLRRPRLDGLV